MRKLLPKSLTGQIALLVGIALFVAQAINFTLLLNERRGARFAQVIAPSVTRLADAADRLANPAARVPAGPGDDADSDSDGRAPRPDRGNRDGRRTFQRVELVAANPIEAGAERRTDLERDIRRGLIDVGVQPGAVVAVVQPVTEDRLLVRKISAARADRLRRMGAELNIAVELPGKGWLVLRSGWPRSERALIWQLLAQTLILYVVVLIPVLLAGRRIARPLRNLAHATQRFRPGEQQPDPVEERGPADVRAVISAYNSLSLRVNAMLDEKDRMLGAIGHDLRTPLMALRVRIESVEDDDDRNKMADTIEEMSRTLGDILSLARLGRPSEPLTDVDVSALVDAVVEDFRDLDKEVTFEEAPRLAMRLRPSLMRRAVRNLIENAVKYGGAAEVHLKSDGATVSIQVSDRGPGIPQKALETVFDPFTRLEESRNRDTGGVGLGLALARAIVRDAGGEITLKNRQGGGLTASIDLPRR